MNAFRVFIIIHQAYIREAINGIGMVLCMNLSLMVAINLYQTWYYNHRSKHWTHVPGVSMACALFWVFASETYRTGAIWHIYRYAPVYTDSVSAIGSFGDVPFGPTFGYLFAGVTLILALLRCTFLFAPPTIRKYVVLLSVYLSLGFLFISWLTERH